MQRSTRDALIALIIGGGISSSLYWLNGHLGLALAVGLCWGCGLAVTARLRRLYPGYATGETWDDKRWAGLNIGLVAFAALIGVSPTLPISAELRLGLGFLVIGTGLVAYATSTIAVLERIKDTSTGSSSNPKTSL